MWSFYALSTGAPVFGPFPLYRQEVVMHFSGRSALGTLVFVGGLTALNSGPDRVHPWSGVAVAAANTVNGAGTSEDGEIWVTAQNTNELRILLGMGGIETVVLPAGTAPHTISFSPDGSYAYVSNIGDGSLIVVRAADRQIVATLELGGGFTHATKASPDGTVLLSANFTTGMLTKIAADEQAETWTPVASLNLATGNVRGPVCVIFRADGQRAYASLFGPAGGIAIVDVPTMTLVGTLPTAGSVSGCGLVNSNDGRTIFLTSAGGTGHFYRLDTWTDTLYEDTSYGSIGIDLHGLAVAANEKTAYITARGVADEIKVLNLDGNDVSTILIDPRPGMADRPDGLARKGSNLYATVRFSGQVARIKLQTGSVEYIDVAPPATTGYAVHGIAVRP
jgi:DNA-binding beta-propeller fold protein YncE